MAHAGQVDLTEDQTRRLEEMARSRTPAARKVLREKIVLRRAKGESFRSIGQALDCDHRTAWHWVKRWEAAGFEGIEHEQEGRGRKSWVIAAKGQEILQKTTQEKPANATHWGRATMALAAGVSESTVGRNWKQNGLKPHRVVGFKVSKDAGASTEKGTLRHDDLRPQTERNDHVVRSAEALYLNRISK